MDVKSCSKPKICHLVTFNVGNDVFFTYEDKIVMYFRYPNVFTDPMLYEDLNLK